MTSRLLNEELGAQVFLKAIAGVEISIDHLEGKWKVSQNRSEADRRGVAEGLSQKDGNNAMAELVAHRDEHLLQAFVEGRASSLTIWCSLPRSARPSSPTTSPCGTGSRPWSRPDSAGSASTICGTRSATY